MSSREAQIVHSYIELKLARWAGIFHHRRYRKNIQQLLLTIPDKNSGYSLR